MLHHLFTTLMTEIKRIFKIFSKAFTEYKRTNYPYQPDFLIKAAIAIYNNEFKDNSNKNLDKELDFYRP